MAQRSSTGKTPKKRATIVDIARRLGVSAMTVSRALTGHPEVSARTRALVQQCAESVGYRPNRWARSLVTQRSRMVGVVIPDISHSFFAQIACGIEEALEPAGYDILLCHSRGDTERELREIDMLLGSRVDGLILASVQPEREPGPVVERIEAAGTPVVLVDRFFPSLDWPSVRTDDRLVGRMATEYLISLGHRRIAHIQGPSLSPASLRKRGYADAMKAAGLGPAVERGDFGIQSGRAATRRLLLAEGGAAPRPTAIFAANDPMAIGAIEAAREEGLHVPRDLAVIGCGNIEGTHHPNPFLTTTDWPLEELGREAATRLLSAIHGDGGEAEASGAALLTPRLIVRQSTGAPPAEP